VRSSAEPSSPMIQASLSPALMPTTCSAPDVGVKRFVDALSDERYESGVFYASKEGKLSGDMVDQSTFFTALKNTSFQDNANAAIHRFTSEARAARTPEDSGTLNAPNGQA
jgi:hypothetical protein